MNISKLIKLLLSTILVVLLTACGSGGGSNSDTNSSKDNTDILKESGEKNNEQNSSKNPDKEIGREPEISDTTSPDIILIGNPTISLKVGENYTDKGATATDDKDGDISNKIVTTGHVDTSKAGTYSITYKVSDKAGNITITTRTVTVTKLKQASDTTPPKITLLGDNPIKIFQGEKFTDLGATATDETDGSVQVTTTGNVDTSKSTTYTITYTAIDKAKNKATKTREVIVKSIPVWFYKYIGDNPMHVTLGAEFKDPGVKFLNKYNRWNTYTTTGEVNTSKAGEYTLTYTATQRGYTTTKTRTVIVEQSEPTIVTRKDPITPANCKGYIEKSGKDLNANNKLDDNEITSSKEHYEDGAPITLSALKLEISNDKDVTKVNTCAITTMDRLFYDKASFNQDISNWNVGSVTSMKEMFYGARLFNQPIKNWNISSVIDYEKFADGSPLKDANNPFAETTNNGEIKLVDKNFKIDISKIKNYDNNASIEEKYLIVINYLRSLKVKCNDKNGFQGPVGTDFVWNVLLEDASKEHSDDMSISGVFSHAGSGTESDLTGQSFNPAKASNPFERMEASGYTYTNAGENIAFKGKTILAGNSTTNPLSADSWIWSMEAWMKSETGHCSNIMNPNFTEFGMAETRDSKKVYNKKIGEWLTKYNAYWTQNFGRPQ